MTLQIKDWCAVPESYRKIALTPKDASEGRESASGEGGGSKLDDKRKAGQQIPPTGRGVASRAARTYAGLPPESDVIAMRSSRTQSPQRKRHAYAVDQASKAERDSCPAKTNPAPSGREPAGGGGNNPPSRRAVCDQHKYGSVRGAPGDGGAYSTKAPENRLVE